MCAVFRIVSARWWRLWEWPRSIAKRLLRLPVRRWALERGFRGAQIHLIVFQELPFLYNELAIDRISYLYSWRRCLSHRSIRFWYTGDWEYREALNFTHRLPARCRSITYSLRDRIRRSFHPDSLQPGSFACSGACSVGFEHNRLRKLPTPYQALSSIYWARRLLKMAQKIKEVAATVKDKVTGHGKHVRLR